MTDIERYIIKEVDPVEFYSREIGWNGEGKTYCPFHKENKPSFEIRNSDGSAYCYGCRTYIRNIVMFYMLSHKASKKKAFFQIFDTYLDALISRSRYAKLMKKLKPGGKPWKYLIRRGISEQTIKKYMLGYNGDRISIPIFNEWGYCVNLRQYDYTGKELKIFSYKKGYGKVRLYPMTSLARKDIVIFEGEMDTLLGLTHGLDCVTLTGGAGSWKSKFIRYFRGKNVTVCMDNDVPGQRGAKLITTDLKRVCSSLVNVVLPKKYGKDFSDYMQHKSFEDFKLLMRSTVQHELDKRGGTGEDLYTSEKAMILTMDKEKEIIHLIIRVDGKR